ncbi:FAD-dependent oxidoreductase [Bradyrhizobium prioriisuperbiae]|uniref:FAD-dependent oxidoreductase n=1 Tax=Bradyrhizobium prioriisuperbiae TaxID=2854389 RepID=UPI0028E6D1AB|nr:FAD-dependent oxidoreductase [Bradyrhizobium prioritasuperba]
MFRALSSLPSHEAYDVVVAGAGAGGLAAALFAAIAGARVLLAEQSDMIGGTTALSAGSVWIPNTHLAGDADDDPAQARLYLDSVIGNHAPAVLREAFLASGPQAIALLDARSEVKFRPYALHPDYEQTQPGATARGRALEPVPFDGLRLGADLNRIRPPLPEFTILGGMMVDRTDIRHLLGMTRSPASAWHSAKLLARYARDRLKIRRGSRLVMGNALVGRLLISLKQYDVTIVTGTTITGLTATDGAVRGVTLAGGGTERVIAARRAVVLAGGGFIGDDDQRRQWLPAAGFLPSACAPGQGGALQKLALGLGARIAEGNRDAAYWAPVSLRRRADGSTAVFPHFVMDRSKPGTICVDQSGRRFVNEATSYHEFARAMLARDRVQPCIPCFIIADARALRAYGLGLVRPGARNLAPFLADGYLVEGPDLAALARKLDIDPATLMQTVERTNVLAASGHDADFGRGSTLYHRVNGDPAVGPNPTLAPLAQPPFYAVRLQPGDIGAARGLVVNEWAQVMRDGRPITGLYACGNAMNSITGGTYPGPGITLGPAITFAYRAMRHALPKA